MTTQGAQHWFGGFPRLRPKFGLALRLPKFQQIATLNNLVVNRVAPGNTISQSSNGAINLIISDLPPTLDYGQLTPSAIVRQATDSDFSSSGPLREAGVCHVVVNIPTKIVQTEIGTFPYQAPVGVYNDVVAYFRIFEGKNIQDWYGSAGPFDNSSAVVIETPKHGVLIAGSCPTDMSSCFVGYYHRPDPGFFGTDVAVIDGTVNGKTVRLRYNLHSISSPQQTHLEICGSKGPIWKISELFYGEIHPTDAQGRS